MIAEVGGIVNVSGRRMATPFAPPSPGSTPMIVPSAMPTTAMNRLNGVTATWNPRKRFSRPIASEPQPGLERPLRHREQEPALEDDEREQRHAEREHGDGDPSVVADPAHVDADVHG